MRNLRGVALKEPEGTERSCRVPSVLGGSPRLAAQPLSGARLAGEAG